MTLPSSGGLSIAQILAELGDSYPVTIPNDRWRALASKPAGPGSLTIPTDFYGASLVTETDNRTSVATSFTSVNFGADGSGRWVVVLVTAGNTGSDPGLTPTATVGGVSATRISAASTGTGSGTAVSAAMFVAQPTGANGTVSVSWSGLNVSIIVLRVITYSLSAAYSSASASSSGMPMSVNVPSNGLIIGFTAQGGSTAITWTGTTEQGTDSVDSNSKRRSRAWDYNQSLQTGKSISVSPWISSPSNGTNAAVCATFSKA